MSATVHGLQDLTFAIPEDEAGIVIQRFSSQRRSDKREIRDKDGEYAAVAAGFGKKIDFTITGFKRGAGVASVLGATMTVANDISGNGITGTTTILDEVGDDMANTEFESLNIRGSGYDL